MSGRGWAILLLTAVACGGSSTGTGGHLEARWTGADTGRFSGPAVAEWCDGERRLEIRAIKGDTGLAVAVLPGVVLSPDSYRVVAPWSRDTAAPSARVALRWFGRTAVLGFQGDSGTLVLERVDSAQLTGQVSARLSSVSNSDRLRVNAEFENLAVVAQSRGCTPEPTAARQTPAPPGID